MKVQFQTLGGGTRIFDIDPKATFGATVGVNVFNADGTLWIPPESGGTGVQITDWSLILNIPPNVTALANTSTTGLYTITGAGTSATRSISAVAGETTVSNGSGASGNPTIGLADLADSGVGATPIKRITRDAKGRVSGTQNATTSDLPEGSNLYFTAARVLATVLSGLSLATGTAITAADSVLVAFGKLQKQITDTIAALANYVTIATSQTITGEKTFSSVEAPSRVNIIAPASNNTALIMAKGGTMNNNIILGRNGLLNRWAMLFADSSAEGGGNSGNNFVIQRYDDAGSLIDNAIIIGRSNGNLYAGIDNSQSLGEASRRWSVVYAGTGTINTSDAREKTAVTPLSESEIACAAALSKEIGWFQWLASAESKGGDARQHVGMTVQRCIEVCKQHGMDPFRWGFVCYDAWDATDAVIGEDGAELSPARPAGDRYSFRMDQLCLFLAAGFNARLSALESSAPVT